MHDDYRALTERISVPDGLSEKVLSAAGGKKRRRPLAGAAVCAAAAIALLLLPREAALPAAAPAAAPAHSAVLAAEEVENHALVLPLEAEAAEGFTVENLGTFINEDGAAILAPVLAGETRALTPVLYAATEESRFLAWPAEGCGTVSLSFPYGSRETPGGAVYHSGIDIPGAQGREIAAAESGTVTEAGFDTSRGNYLILDHGGGLTTLYAHCQELLAAEGDSVKAGETIALLGSTGMSTGPHLHFEVRVDGKAQNPVAYFTKEVREGLKMG